MESKRPSYKVIPSDRIVVLKQAKVKDIGTGTIEIVQEKLPEIGEIIAFGGPGEHENGEPRMYPMSMKVGDIVAYRKFGESKFYIGGDETIFVSFDDVLGVIRKLSRKKGKKNER